jgi:hypothetical protein
MAGFNSPNILFLNTYDSLDRKYVSELASSLQKAGYDRYVELYCGSFVMPLVMANAGYKPEQIYCYDVSLLSNVLGSVFSEKPLKNLGVKIDGEILQLTGEPLEDAGIILYEQALARFRKAGEIEYYRMLVEDMEYRKEEHIKHLKDKVERMDKALHGLHFEKEYIWDAFEKEKDKENTFICSNPPTYPGAYEKFFDTDGVVTWNDVEYPLWVGSEDCPKLAEEAKDCKALLLFLQQADKGKSATEHPVSARYLSETQNVYYNSNRPYEIAEMIGFKTETVANIATKKSRYPIMPEDYEITKRSRIDVFVEDTKVAEYYRGLWLHRITGKSVSVNLCVLVDGMIAGFIGLDFNAIIKPYNTNSDCIPVVLSYAVPAPNKKQRIARLLVEIAKSKTILDKTLANTGCSVYLQSADCLLTVEYSRFTEVKGLRGLMKVKRKEKKGAVNALTYHADFTEKTEKIIRNEFIAKEENYAKKGGKNG